MEPSDALTIEQTKNGLVLTLNRPEKGNTITEELVASFAAALDEAEANPEVRVVVIRGKDGCFCTGMDFNEFARRQDEPLATDKINARYMALLSRFSSTSKVVIAQVDGTVVAGGVGIVSACDLVFSTERSTFALSEALWGLLPCMVTPFLVRRVGFQPAYRLTLSTAPISAAEAYRIHLIEELCDDIDARIQSTTRRLSRVAPETVVNLKTYFKDMWILSEEMKSRATNELARMSQQPLVQTNIRTFIESGRFPWQKG